MLLDRVEADRAQVVDRGAEADRLGHRRRARLELVRQRAPRRRLVADGSDHVAAEQEGLHLLEQLGAAPEGAGAARAAHLVPGDGEEVAAERLHVERAMRRGLRGVADDDRAAARAPRRRAARPGCSSRASWRSARQRRPSRCRCPRPRRADRAGAPRGRRAAACGTAAPVRFAMYCHGTKFEWCSSSVTSTTSPGPSSFRPQEYATRLSPSVAFRTKITSRADWCIQQRAHLLARASSSSVARSASR